VDAWEIHSRFHAAGFKLFQEASSSETACPCSPLSSMTRCFTVRLTLCEEHYAGFIIDVQDVDECIDIMDLEGHPVTLGTCADAIRASPQRRAMPGCHQACHPSLLVGCSAGRCVIPPRKFPPCYSPASAPRLDQPHGDGEHASLWSQLSQSCVLGPGCSEEAAASELLIY
jgi:hypothetical protein